MSEDENVFGLGSEHEGSDDDVPPPLIDVDPHPPHDDGLYTPRGDASDVDLPPPVAPHDAPPGAGLPSSSSAPAPPSPSLAEEEAEGADRPPALPSEATVILPNGGKVSLYSYGRFEATCGNKGCHGNRCRKSLTAKKAKPSQMLRFPTRGRPLGFLMSWINDGYDHDDHIRFVPTLEQRQAGRDALKAIGGLQVMALLHGEQEGEADGTEPEVFEV